MGWKPALRFWAFLDGTAQEMLDHYYLSITLSAQKMFADYRAAADRAADGPHPGRPHHGDACNVHHPKLRRFVLVGPRAHQRRAGREKQYVTNQ